MKICLLPSSVFHSVATCLRRISRYQEATSSGYFLTVSSMFDTSFACPWDVDELVTNKLGTSAIFASGPCPAGPAAGLASSCKEGSFSAASKPNFASKYAFESSRRDLHNALLCTALHLNFLSNFAKMLPNLAWQKLANFLAMFKQKLYGAKQCIL